MNGRKYNRDKIHNRKTGINGRRKILLRVYNLPEKMTEKSAQLFLEDTCLKDMMELYERELFVVHTKNIIRQLKLQKVGNKSGICSLEKSENM